MEAGMVTAKKHGDLGVTVIMIILLGLCSDEILAQNSSLERLNALILKNLYSNADSAVIKGMFGDGHKLLLTNFTREKVDKFYDSVAEPADYFVNMKIHLDWNFGTYIRKMQNYIINKIDSNSTSHDWRIEETPNFVIYYTLSANDSTVIKNLGIYLEAVFWEMKKLLVIYEKPYIRSLLIKSFYPDSAKSFRVPSPPERTNGKIQILLFPHMHEFQRHFPNSNVDQNTGGICLFSLYQRPQNSIREILINVRVAMVFGGYISFPFLAHELAHALRFIYYSDLDNLDKEAARLYEIYEKQGKEAYANAFWPDFKNRIPGNNGIFEEAIANYSMFSTGPLNRSGIIPPLNCLIGQKLKKSEKYIIQGTKGGIDFGLLNLIGWKLGISQGPDKRVVKTIFAWADFLKYLDDSSTPRQMRQLYSVTDQDLSLAFQRIFGRSIKQAAVEWSTRINKN